MIFWVMKLVAFTKLAFHLSILRYNRDITFNLGLTISFERAASFTDGIRRSQMVLSMLPCLMGGKIIINDFKISVPIVDYESNYADEMKAKLYKNPVLHFNYFVWSVHEEHGFKGKNM